MDHADTLQLTETFKRALEGILARVLVSPEAPPAIAVAYSGGLDSSVLLHLAREYAASRGIALFAFHVHHGLSPNADAWLAHCRAECEKTKVPFDARRVHVAKQDGRGIEAAARGVRYRALGELCRLHGVTLLLTAHHQDDQAETVLLQMLRGAGLAGLSGMEAASRAPDLLGEANMVIGRPLLQVRRADLSAFAAQEGMTHIEDESNRDVHHPRNALRNEVLPMLATYFPAYQTCLARGAQHAQAAQRLLDALAAQDAAACADGDGLNAVAVEKLNDDRVANLLRYWLASKGMSTPSTAWLAEARSQLLGARADTQACVTLGDWQVRRYRQRIVLTPAQPPADGVPVTFRWHGETRLPFPALGGALYVEPAERGIDPAWLRDQTLRLQFQRGGSQLKLAANRPAKPLKAWYQEQAIPAWERQRLPLVFAAEGRLLFAAGLGMDCRLPQAAPGLRMRWSLD